MSESFASDLVHFTKENKDKNIFFHSYNYLAFVLLKFSVVILMLIILSSVGF